MKRALALLVVLSLTFPAFAEFPEEVTIGDMKFKCRTVTGIRELGLTCEDIPWKDNAARLYIEAMNAHRREPGEGEFQRALGLALRTFDFTGIAAEMQRHFEENRRVFELLNQADRMPHYQFPMQRSESIADVRIMAGLAQFQALGRERAWRAAFEFSRQKHRAAIEHCCLSMRMGQRVASDGMLIRWLVGVAVQGMAVKTLDRMVASGRLDEATLKDLGQRFAKMRPRLEDYVYAAHSERIFRLLWISELERMEPEEIEELVERGKLPPGQVFDPKVSRKRIKAIFDFLETQAKKPPHEALKSENRFEVLAKKHAEEWGPDVRRQASAMAKVRVTDVRRRVQFEVLQLRVALERFKLAKRTYPERLAELVSAYLEKVTLDPCSGKPYGYRLEADGGFTLWSVGDDLKDDGGVLERYYPWGGPDYVFTSRKEKPRQ